MDWSNPLVFIIAGGTLVTIGIWVGKMEYFKGTVEKTLREVRDDIKTLLERIGPNPVSSNSPRVLTDFGKEISQQADVALWAKQQAQNLSAKVAGKEDFEIEALAVSDVKEAYENSFEFQRRIDKCAYDKDIDKEKVMAVFEIELRDALLAMSGDISV